MLGENAEMKGALSRQPRSDKMARQQEVGNALTDAILVAAVGTDQFALHDLCLNEETMQFLEYSLILLELVCRRRLFWQRREPQLEVLVGFS